MSIPRTDIAIDNETDTAWLVAEGHTSFHDRPCDTCRGRKDFHPTYGDHSKCPPKLCQYFGIGCPDCDGTGRHTFTLDVDTNVGWRGIEDGPPNLPDIFTVHVVQVLPIVEWDTVDLGLPHAVPCMTIDPHGNGLEVTERDAHDYFGINRTLPASAAPGKYAVQLAIHESDTP
jgi:hypothetical protein